MADLTLRYERKFIDKILDIKEFEHSILNHPSGFKEVYSQRCVNNIYFDDDRFSLFSKNIEGYYDRIKYRIRWYGDILSEIKKPKLELKIKKGLLGYKRSFSLKPFSLELLNYNNSFNKLIYESEIPIEIKESLKFLRPKLINNYTRKYFISTISPHIRLTMDNQLKYYRPLLAYNNRSEFPNSVKVIELKYDNKKEDNIDFVSGQLNFRLSKFSKYVNGIIFLYK